MRKSRRELFGIDEPVRLGELPTPPDSVDDRRHKCRLLYGRRIGTPQFEPYHPQRVTSLRAVAAESLDYHLKYADRRLLTELRKRRGECDEIIIVVDGMVTDTSYSNLAFFDGSRWYTPDTPLLAGTKRDELIRTGTLEVARIAVSDIHRYERASLINSMLDLDQISVSVASIRLEGLLDDR